MNQLVDQIAKTLATDRSDSGRLEWAEKLIQESIPLRDLLPLLDREDKVPMYFCWMLGGIVEKAPGMLVPVLPDLFARQAESTIPGYRRSLSKWMYHAGLPEGEEGEALDCLFVWARDPAVDVSTRRFALLAILRQVGSFPDLRSELILVLEEQRDLHTKAFRKQVDKMMASLDGL